MSEIESEKRDREERGREQNEKTRERSDGEE